MMRKILFVGFVLAVLLVALLPVSAETPQPATNQTVYGTVQEFEHGLMIWRSDTAYIWALIDDGTAFGFPASSYSALPDNPIFGDPPSRLRPIFGFGKVWGNVANVRNLLGWPTRQEIGYNMPISASGGVISITQLNGTVINISGGSWYRTSTTPTPLPPPGASILTFDYTPRVAARGTEVVVSWTMQGVDVALVEVYDTANNTFVTSQSGLPLNGSTSITVPNMIQGNLRVIVYGARVLDSSPLPEYQKVVQRSAVVQIETQTDATVLSYAAYQDYQRGFMIWRADNESIYVFYASDGSTGGSYSVYPINTYRNLPDNPFPDPAPSGLIKPGSGFGRIWGNTQHVRNSLGWAIANEQGYNTTVVLAGLVPQTMTLPNGGTVLLTQYGQWAYV